MEQGQMMGGKIDMSILISTMKDKMSGMMNDVQQGKIKTMSRVIDDMSHSIWEMSLAMGSGKITSKEMKKMRNRIMEI
jgi:altronate dehydratase